MIITIGGPVGSGKGTVAKLLCEKLHLKQYSGGGFRRLKAKSLGMTLEDFNKMGEKEAFTDTEADEWQKNLGQTDDNFVIDSRLGFYFIPHSIKILLTVDVDAGAARVWSDVNDTRINQTRGKTVEEQKKINVTRDLSDTLRYEKYYGIKNFMSPKNYDIVIDTSHITPQQAVDKIIEYINDHNRQT
jgi:cytidylate kinase